MQTPYPSVHFPLLLVCRPRSLEEKTRMPASPAKRSCGASSPEAQRGTVCGRRPLGTLGWRGLGARIPAFGLHASVCSSDEPTGWPCRVCVCARVCVRAHAQANQDRSGRYCCCVWWDFVATAPLWGQGSVLFTQLDATSCVPGHGSGLDSLLEVWGTVLEDQCCSSEL